MSLLAIPHLALPFDFGSDGTANVIQQDSLDEVTQCVVVLLSTNVGSRTEMPTYGIADPAFTTVINTAAISQAIATWEPRAQVQVSAGSGPTAPVTVDISVAGQSGSTSVAITTS